MSKEGTSQEPPINVNDIRVAIESPKVTRLFRTDVSNMLDRGYTLSRAELSCIAGLTSTDVPKLPGETIRVSRTAHLLITINQVPVLVVNDGIESLAV